MGFGIGSAIAGAAAKAVDQGINLWQYNKSLGLAYDQMNMQREFAQNGIRWRVADAKAAGIHPLVALGAPTLSASGVAGPQQTGTDFASMGQSFERAKEAKALEDERQLNSELVKANIRKVNAETDFVQQQAKNAASAVASTALPPAMPKVNAKSASPVPGGYAGPVKPLLTLARVGRTLLDVVNPDFADSITESQYRNMIANVSPEWNVSKGYLKAPIDYLDPSERDAVKSGKYELVRFPGGWLYQERRASPAETYKKRHGSDAWHDPSNWKWLERLSQWLRRR